MIKRMIGAAKLQPETYEEVEADKSATLQALLVVALVALASGIGTLGSGSVLALPVGILVAMLGWADRLAGGAVGLMAALLAAGLIMLPALAYAPSGDAILRQSVFAPYVTLVTDLATELVPEDLAVRYRNKMESLRQHWRQRFLESDPTAL